MKRVTVLGGAGIFGGRVARALIATERLAVTVAGRNRERGEAFAREIGAAFAVVRLDDFRSLNALLGGCDLLIHAAGPFQGRDYRVARACIEHEVNYIDLADAREFVTGIADLDAAARARGVFIGSGASSVPTITHALVSEISAEFARIDTIDIALAPGNQNPRGAATVGAVLSSLGAPSQVWIEGEWRTRHGWGDAIWLDFPPPVGRRAVFNCAVPDLDLFPTEFRARTVRFRAGLELPAFNRVLSSLALLRRMHLVPRLERLAPLAVRISLLFYGRGTKNGAVAVWLRGTDHDGRSSERKIAFVTTDDGPATPCAPGILLARRLLLGEGIPPGARTCMGLLTLSEIREHLAPLGIWCARSDAGGQWSSAPLARSARSPGG
jgi:saccharopine dehydrogenase-like NADP-dependent oxidoreductase